MAGRGRLLGASALTARETPPIVSRRPTCYFDQVPGLPIDKPSRARILALAGQGSGVRAIARLLAAEAKAKPGSVQAVSVASVGRLLQEARAKVNTARSPAKPSRARKTKPAKPVPSTPPAPAAPPESPPAASAAPPAAEPETPLPDLRAALDELEAADQIHERLRKRLAFTADRIDQVLQQAQPDMTLFRALTSIERPLVEQVIATRPPERHKPEDDPCNLELQRVVVATLRARVEAARAARATA